VIANAVAVPAVRLAACPLAVAQEEIYAGRMHKVIRITVASHRPTCGRNRWERVHQPLDRESR